MAVAASQARWSHLWFVGVRECPPWCSIVGAPVIVHQFFCILNVTALPRCNYIKRVYYFIRTEKKKIPVGTPGV